MLMLLTYDIDRDWTEVRDAALAAGFRGDAVTNDLRVVPLPNTTLLVEAVSPHEALERFKFLVRNVNIAIRIIRAAAFDWETAEWYADPASPLGSLFGLGFLPCDAPAAL